MNDRDITWKGNQRGHMSEHDLSGGLRVKDLSWVKERVKRAEWYEDIAKKLYLAQENNDEGAAMMLLSQIVTSGMILARK